MNCPVCDKSFDTENLLVKHLDVHKNDSILNSTPEKSLSVSTTKQKQISLDLANIFGKEKFENSINSKIENIDDVEELVYRRNFIEQVKQIIANHPFVFLEYFVDDLFHGKDSKELLEKYFISDYLSLKHIIQNILGFEGNRYKARQYENAFIMNMKVPTWKEKYEILKDNCDFFRKELAKITFHNVLRAYIILFMTDYVDSGLSRNDIILKSKNLKNHYDIFPFINNFLINYFEEHFTKTFKTIADDIISELVDSEIFKKTHYGSELLVGKISIDRIKENIVNELKYNTTGIPERNFKKIITTKFPSLDLIPEIGVWKTALRELENEQIINIELRSNFKNSGLIMLNEDYEKIQQKLEHFGNSGVEFYGRKISPENFIYELKELDKGDFGDKDDQVTRIAGLILTESVKLQAPHERISEFDFSTDISNYKFRQEQLETMSKLGFELYSKIIHCKVILDDILTLKEYQKLRTTLPENEQGVVITFKKVPSEVQEEINKNKTIQIIDEDGLKAWASLTTIIPARKNSVAKIYFDPLSKIKKKIVKINLIDYEKGIASVAVLPDMKNVTVLVRSNEEIQLNESHPKDFDVFASNYLEFLNMLYKLSTKSNVSDGMFDQKILETTTKSRNHMSLNFENHAVELNLDSVTKNNLLHCDCMKWSEDKFYLCPHLVTAFDYAFRTFSVFNETWNKPNNSLRQSLELLIKENISVILDRLGVEKELGDIKGDKMIPDFVLGMAKIKKMS